MLCPFYPGHIFCKHLPRTSSCATVVHPRTTTSQSQMEFFSGHCAAQYFGAGKAKLCFSGLGLHKQFHTLHTHTQFAAKQQHSPCCICLKDHDRQLIIHTMVILCDSALELLHCEPKHHLDTNGRQTIRPTYPLLCTFQASMHSGTFTPTQLAAVQTVTKHQESKNNF